MDAAIQQILEKLRALGLEEDTIVVFTSDHGETLYDHDCYFDHHGLYDPTLVVPFIVVWKNHLPKGLRITDTVQLGHHPHALDMMGIDTGLPFDGRSLIRSFAAGTAKGRRVLHYGMHLDAQACWRTGVEADDLAGAGLPLQAPGGTVQLVNDPEYDNLADKRPEVVKMLTDRMNAWIESASRRPRPSPIG